TKLEAAEDEVAELKRKLRKTNEDYRQKINVEKKDKSHSTTSPPRPTPKQRNKNGSLKKRISFHEDIVREDKQEDLFSRKEDDAARVLQRNWKKYNYQ
ncbi:Hypothetical predicted protein, partial [Paramuricea clavata]